MDQNPMTFALIFMRPWDEREHRPHVLTNLLCGSARWLNQYLFWEIDFLFCLTQKVPLKRLKVNGNIVVWLQYHLKEEAVCLEW